jgi:uncharacterized protein (DUF488 family)
MQEAPPTIYTIGHSTHHIDDFMAMLQCFHIQVLADVRSFPGSRRHSQFNRQELSQSLLKQGIGYVHLPALGGRQQISAGNSANRFSSYAGYMQTDGFNTGIATLTEIAAHKPVVYMCAEANWQNCHRSLISDYLHTRGWQILHIISLNKVQEHRLTGEGKDPQGSLF